MKIGTIFLLLFAILNTLTLRSTSLDQQEISGLSQIQAKWNGIVDWTGPPSCEWPHLHCSASDHVIKLAIHGLLLGEEIPDEISSLSYLEELTLSNASLIGEISPTIASLPKLRILNLSHNQLTGPIPNLLALLTILDLQHNKLSGGLPVNLYRLFSLKFLELNHNRLTGTISDSIGNLMQLETLVLHSNLLTGSIPQSIEKLTRLSRVSLGKNSLTGIIPPTICSLRSASDFQLGPNFFACPLPSCCGCDLNASCHQRLNGTQMADLQNGDPSDNLNIWMSIAVLGLLICGRFLVNNYIESCVAAPESITVDDDI